MEESNKNSILSLKSMAKQNIEISLKRVLIFILSDVDVICTKLERDAPVLYIYLTNKVFLWMSKHEVIKMFFI